MKKYEVRPTAKIQLPRVGRLATSTVGLTTLSSVITLAANFLTGVITARSIGDTGRGEMAAVQTTVIFITFLSGLGIYQAASYLRASNKLTGRDLLGTMLVPSLVLGLLTVLLIELLGPVFLSRQSDHVIYLVRVYALSAVTVPVVDLMTGIVIGDQRYRLAILLRAWTPITTAAIYSLLWLLDKFSLELALFLPVIANIVPLVLLAHAVSSRYTIGTFSRGALRTVGSFGVRSHLTGLTAMVNWRLDLFLLPSFLTASAVGHYALAASLATVVGQLPSALVGLVVPMAARKGEARSTVKRIALISGFLGLAGALPLIAFAPWLINLVYGDSFSASAAPLRILALGTVALTVASVFSSGLMAQNKPLSAGLGQVFGVAVTIIGLSIAFALQASIIYVAVISSVAYNVIMVVNMLLFFRAERESRTETT